MKKTRTEQEVLNDFENLGYEVVRNDNSIIKLDNYTDILTISKVGRWYYYKGYDFLNNEMTVRIGMQEHKLLTELFKIWGWYND